MIIQIIVTVFLLFALSRLYLQFKYNHISLLQFLFWVGVWGGVIFIIFWPNLTDKFADFLGIKRGIDVFVYFGIIVLFYLIFRSYIKIEEMEREITKLVRKMAIKELKDKENNKT
ncbi:MAG: hypothetical protein UR27_C0017G0017 [Candidatus Peregrinibacteria bacterium GW2011_GWA2_33_10]|nr:MAG: hypothetical protein UR27_C0017G0017 [Candidatus Peregrinibacteria bacterium GW2011_GWA2_33_10]KKP41128.1 MAG: hypothetical protein UR30_C0002G0162 [Candidatus Peregrinibacteria bacterium GW2011_GWC2_33_13]OGJ48857.1 MAG: hypothetical protein A2229_05120 [Candidatus Peregrinibacteria bacterium RIFOXYA2_FULL_33_7]